VFQGEQVSTRRFAPPTEQGIRSQIKGTQRAYQLAGDSNQLLAGTLKEGDHIDVVGNWTVKVPGGNGDDHHVTRDILRNILVMRAPTGSGSSTVTTGDKSQDVQLRVTDVQSQKLFWIEKNGDWHLTLRPPVNAVDSGNTIQEVDTMYFDGPGRRP
jgi:Flp pilus assembly protein CpaB